MSTRTTSSRVCRCGPNRSLSRYLQICRYTMKTCDDHIWMEQREASLECRGGDEHPCSPARCRRHPDTMSPGDSPDLTGHQWITSSLGARCPTKALPVRARSSRRMCVGTCRCLSNSPGMLIRPFGCGVALLPGLPVLQQRPHHAHKEVGRRHQGDLFPLLIITPYPLEVRPDRRRAPRGARDIPGRPEVHDPHGFGRQRCRRSHAQGEPCVLSSGDRTRRSNRSRGLPEGTRPPVAPARPGEPRDRNPRPDRARDRRFTCAVARSARVRDGGAVRTAT
jgi:hypothetical protein